MEYYSTIRRNVVQIHATTWINTANIILSRRSQSQKTLYYIIYMKCLEWTNLQKKEDYWLSRDPG